MLLLLHGIILYFDIIFAIAITPPGIELVFSTTEDIAGSLVVIPAISQETYLSMIYGLHFRWAQIAGGMNYTTNRELDHVSD